MHTNPVLTSARFVVERSTFVSIGHDRIRELAGSFKFKEEEWSSGFCPVDLTRAQTANYILALSALNFCFWPLAPPLRWHFNCGGQKIGGYFGLAAAFRRALEEGVPIYDAEFMKNASIDDLRRIFRGGTEIPLIFERLNNLNEVGRVLLEKYDGEFENLLNDCGFSTPGVLERIAVDFSSFRDEEMYEGRRVSFYKRAQICVADLAANLPPFTFKKMYYLTAFADYKIPQILRELGVLVYREDLAQKIDGFGFIIKGSEEEVEIRANMVWAVELFTRELQERRTIVLTASEIDYALWEESQRIVMEHPHHRTMTTAY